MAITRTPMIDDDGSGTTGTVINNAWKTELYNQIDGIGSWIVRPYSAGDFVAGAGTWTVPAGGCTYYSSKVGKQMTVSIYLSGTTLSAATNFVRIWLPEFVTFKQTFLAGLYQAGSGWIVATATVSAGARNLDCYTLTGGNLAAGSMDFTFNGVVNAV